MKGIYDTEKDLKIIVTGSSKLNTFKKMGDSADSIFDIGLFHQLVKINAAATMIGTDAAAGTGEVCILENYIEANSIGKATLNPKSHSGLTGLNDSAVKFFAELIFRNHFLNTLD